MGGEYEQRDYSKINSLIENLHKVDAYQAMEGVNEDAQNLKNRKKLLKKSKKDKKSKKTKKKDILVNLADELFDNTHPGFRRKPPKDPLSHFQLAEDNIKLINATVVDQVGDKKSEDDQKFIDFPTPISDIRKYYRKTSISIMQDDPTMKRRQKSAEKLNPQNTRKVEFYKYFMHHQQTTKLRNEDLFPYWMKEIYKKDLVDFLMNSF